MRRKIIGETKEFRKSLSFRFCSSFGKKTSTERVENYFYKNENKNSQPPFDRLGLATKIYEEKGRRRRKKKKTEKKNPVMMKRYDSYMDFKLKKWDL